MKANIYTLARRCHAQAKLTREFLTEEYSVAGKPIRQIAKETGIGFPAIQVAIRKFGIRSKRPKPRELLTRGVLVKWYIDEEMSVKEIAERIGIKSHASITSRLKEFGIPCRNPGWLSKERLRSHERRRRKCGYGQIAGAYWCSVRHGAKSREYEVTITIQDAWSKWLVQAGRCALTGVKLHLVWERKKLLSKEEEQTASFDRIDSKRGYVPGNVQWVHKDIQRLKMNMPEERFIEWCEKVATHRGYK